MMLTGLPDEQRYDAKHAELEGTLRELDKLRQEHSTLQSQRDRGRADEGMREEFDALQREYAQQEDVSMIVDALCTCRITDALCARSSVDELHPARARAQGRGYVAFGRAPTAVWSK